jgi:hypothetical protein
MKTFAAAFLMIVTLAASAHAGWRNPVPVTVRTQTYNGGSYKEAWAALGDARASTDNFQYLTCRIAAGTLDSRPGVACWAGDASLNYASCVTSAPQMVAIVASISDSSWVYFRDDGAGNCVDIEIYQSSTYAPRQP